MTLAIYLLPLLWRLPAPLPPAEDVETRVVLKQLTTAHRVLAELKGILSKLPAAEILLNILSLQAVPGGLLLAERQ